MKSVAPSARASAAQTVPRAPDGEREADGRAPRKLCTGRARPVGRQLEQRRSARRAARRQ